MEILGLIGFHFLLAPFVAWWALSWWIIIPCAVAFMISISALMPSRGKYGKVNHASAAICLAIIGILTATGIGYNSKDTGFWLSALEGAKFFVKFFACLKKLMCPSCNPSKVPKTIIFFMFFIISKFVESVSFYPHWHKA